MHDQTAQIEWNGAVPVSTRFDDPYYSLEDGLAETRHVFLDGNDLPARFTNGFHIAELGFGTGLNFLTALAAFRASGTQGRLRFTSFEAFPMTKADRNEALKPFTDLPLDGFDNPEDADLTIIEGDARETLESWQGAVDAWFLDGFSPAKNPELWEAGLLTQVAAKLKPGGTLATYTAAGHVRRALESAGLKVERTPGFGRKRHMTRARKPI